MCIVLVVGAAHTLSGGKELKAKKRRVIKAQAAKHDVHRLEYWPLLLFIKFPLQLLLPMVFKEFVITCDNR